LISFDVLRIRNLFTDYTHLSNSGKTIVLIWIPSHIGIRGNEYADEAAKSALTLKMSAVKYLPTGIYPDVLSDCPRI